ncbi:MAG: ribonuclease H-like domain-containing protein [Synergistaceae bacterium]|jgi:uncharacterized protein YprB with RNaseH-like and TPR domain|nr:ribonuclease H-like domain-containing protein [Synergistaceae bacterium]
MGKFDRLFGNDAAAISEKKQARHGRAEDAVRDLPDGEWVADGVYRTETRYWAQEAYGRAAIGNPDRMEVMRHLGAKGSVVFLDLETTGLSGGTGTYAFLCGLGTTSGEYFKVAQYFLKSPAYEAQWLDAINSGIPEGATLATYNGRSFDIPILLTRHILARRRPHWESFPHIDLLHISRRLYRGYLESCSLGSVEKHVLGVKRSGEDIPGSMIPGLYLQYLHSGDASSLRGVFYHNRLDIASLASLYCHASRALCGESSDGRELLRAGDIWLRMGRNERASSLWGMAMDSGDPASRVHATLRAAHFAKKNQDYETARKYFARALAEIGHRQSARTAGGAAAGALEELAKLEEHRFMSPARALDHVNEALRVLKSERLYGGSSANIAMIRSMEHRKARLEKKIRPPGNGTGTEKNAG